MTFLQENKNMFDILVYVYEHCRQADVSGDPERVAKRLSAAGFEDADISAALAWLAGIVQAPRRGAAPRPEDAPAFPANAPPENAKQDVRAPAERLGFARDPGSRKRALEKLDGLHSAAPLQATSSAMRER